MLYTLVCVVGIFLTCSLLGVMAFVWWTERKNRKGMEKGLRIVYRKNHPGATLWRNLHSRYWKYHRMKRGSVVVMPSNVWIEMNPKEGSVAILHELGHIMVDIAWLTLDGANYWKHFEASRTCLHTEAIFEFMAWGVAAQIGKIDKEWLLDFVIRIYEKLYGKTKIRAALAIAISTPLTKHGIVLSTRRVGKVLFL